MAVSLCCVLLLHVGHNNRTGEGTFGLMGRLIPLHKAKNQPWFLSKKAHFVKQFG